MKCPKCGAPMFLVKGYGKDKDRWVCKNKIDRVDGSVWYCDKTVVKEPEVDSNA